MAQTTYIDGWPGAAKAISQAPKSYPLRKYGDLSHAVYTREYMQALASFTPTAIGTEDLLSSGFYLVDESVPELTRGAICRFSRTYANVPAARTRFTSGNFELPLTPGFSGMTYNYGSEATGNAGLIYRSSSTSTTFKMHTRRAVSADTGAASAPSGGTYTITIPNLGTTAGIAYNANAATVQTAMRAVAGYDVAKWDITAVASSDTNYPIALGTNVAGHALSLTAVAGSGMAVYNGLSYTTAPTTSSVTMSLSGVTFEPIPLEGGVALTDTYKYVQERLYYSASIGPYLREVASSLYGVIFQFPAYFVKYSNFGEYIATRARVVSGSLSITGPLGTQNVTLPTGDPYTWSQAQINTLGEAMATAYIAATGAGSAVCENGKIGSFIGGLPAPFPVSPINSPQGFYNVIGFNAATLLPSFTSYSTAPGGWSCKITLYGTDITINASSTSSSVKTALNAITAVSTLGLSYTVNLTQRTYGVSLLYSVSGVAKTPTFTSSVTPSPVAINSYYSGGLWLYGLFSGAATSRILTTTNPHGLTGKEKIYIKQGSTYTIDVIGYSIVDANRISALTTLVPLNGSTTITEIGKFISQYTPGVTKTVLRETVDYWLPSPTGSIRDASEIPVQAGNPTSSDIFDALFSSADGFIPYGPSELSEYLGSIYQRKTVSIKLA